MLYNAKSGHLGGSLSIVEILVALYYSVMNIDPQSPDKEDRDRFILSKGHAAPALYTVLAHRGYFSKETLLTSFRTCDGILQGHPDMKKTPGIDMTSGSLGIGLSAGCGIALGAKITNQAFRVYVLIGDGETNEGQVWEAAMTAAHYHLNNLIAFVDVNGFQNDGATAETMLMEPLAEKWRAFRWNALEVNGHDLKQLLDAIDEAKTCLHTPSVILCHTVKGKGISFMEHQIKFHGFHLDDEQFQQAMHELL